MSHVILQNSKVKHPIPLHTEAQKQRLAQGLLIHLDFQGASHRQFLKLFLSFQRFYQEPWVKNVIVKHQLDCNSLTTVFKALELHL